MNTTDPLLPQLRHNGAAQAAATMGIILVVIWVVQFVNVADSYGLDQSFGINPHVISSLPDIFTAPLLHLNWQHIEGNSVPLLVLGFLAAYRGLRKFAWVTVSIIVVSGLFVWLAAPSGEVTVGASGVIAGWLGYVLLRGFFDRSKVDIVIGVVAGLLYLGAFDFLPNSAGISWQDHLGGLVCGMACAWFFRTHKTSTAKEAATS
jgi:membrane associated rhomboid family serine protease